MKTLILGAAGMAGHAVALTLRSRGAHVTGFARRPLPYPNDAFIQGDALCPDDLRRTLDSDNFDVVINCIGVLNTAVDAHPADGITLNSALPHRLAEWTQGSKTRVVHLSTDCVFDGHANGGHQWRGYREDSFRDADTLYGRSKALGELIDGKNLTIRTSIVGPDTNPGGVGLFNWFMAQQGSVGGFTQAIWTGVTTMVLAQAIAAALEQGLTGLYHLVNGRSISKYELLGLFNTLRREPLDIVPTDGTRVDKSLVNTRADFDFAVPTYAAMVAGMGDWLRVHADLYPHYAGKLK